MPPSAGGRSGLSAAQCPDGALAWQVGMEVALLEKGPKRQTTIWWVSPYFLTQLSFLGRNR